MKHSSCAATILLAVFLIGPGSDVLAKDAETTLQKISRTGEFVIGYRTDASPLSYENAQGEPSGYSVDLCRRIAAQVKLHLGRDDIETKFVPATPARDRCRKRASFSPRLSRPVWNRCW